MVMLVITDAPQDFGGTNSPAFFFKHINGDLPVACLPRAEPCFHQELIEFFFVYQRVCSEAVLLVPRVAINLFDEMMT